MQSARRHADQVQDAMQGIGGDIWSLVPIVGEPVADVRHLGNALDHLTTAAEIGRRDVAGRQRRRQATLFGDGSVDVPTLKTLVGAIDEASVNLDAAQLELGEVNDSALGVGTDSADARDEAERRGDPAGRQRPPGQAAGRGAARRSSAPTAGRTYLLALLNPSEQRFSGGAPLTVVPMDVSGRQADDGRGARHLRPRPVPGRPVGQGRGQPVPHGKLRLSTATFAPDWSVSGEELLRGWDPAHRPGDRRPDRGRRRRPRRHAADHRDRSRRRSTARSTPATSPRSWSATTTPSPTTRPATTSTARSSRVFAERVLAPGNGIEKIESLRDSARGRHFALWMRDPDVQAAVADIGLAGDLSDTEHDYVAVFNQNTNRSKADYWQRRTVTSDVQLREDGSAKVRLTISVHNDSPPYGANQTSPTRAAAATSPAGTA